MEGLIWINEHLHGSMIVNNIVKFITMLGDDGLIWIVLGVCFLLFKKTRKSGFVMLISLAVGFVLNDFVLKVIISRPRPFAVNEDILAFIESVGYDLPSGYSFPSGHAYSAFNCAVILMLFNKKNGYYALPLAILISLSRIFMCVHYPTDVLAGAVLGIITALIVYAVYKRICKSIVASKRKKIRQSN